MKEDTTLRPLHQSYKVFDNLYAGEYPGDKNPTAAKEKIDAMLRFGVRHFIDLTEEGELRPYSHLLPADTTYTRFPIKDLGAPDSVGKTLLLIDKITELTRRGGIVYIHGWGGVGRTGTIVSCYFTDYIGESKYIDISAETVINRMRVCFRDMPKATYRQSPETDAQIQFIKKFVATYKEAKDESDRLRRDRIRGSLMAGAAGDALGYTVEFMKYKNIIAAYGYPGITRFELTNQGKALISDDTQMTLFTANGMLMGITRGTIRGIGGAPEDYVSVAYQDWYYTQTGRKYFQGTKYTWLRDMPEMAHRRAPGITCLDACKALGMHREVRNNSKGCGGIMRVAPMGLFMAVHPLYSIEKIDEAGAEIAAVTHRHPLGFLPAAMLTHLLRQLVVTETEEIRSSIAEIALETINCLDKIYVGEYDKEKRYLADLTRKAVALAANGKTDKENIAALGEGWVAEETWAIALYCAVRHVDSMRDAIIASVNHDGDSDSTGSVCGNIMGAIYGYDAIIDENLFCPADKKFKDTLELHDIILAMADDLHTVCILREFDYDSTPEKHRWYMRYCQMIPDGIAD